MQLLLQAAAATAAAIAAAAEALPGPTARRLLTTRPKNKPSNQTIQAINHPNWTRGPASAALRATWRLIACKANMDKFLGIRSFTLSPSSPTGALRALAPSIEPDPKTHLGDPCSRYETQLLGCAF
jgi:hypothetical protein